jgi:hypothetical protein
MEIETKKEEDLEGGIKGEISFVLDSYDDLFSDFDPRPYNVRALSDDFLLESKKAVVVKDKAIELRFLVLKQKRNSFYERIIKKRLKEYFQKHFKEKKREINAERKVGFFWFLLGAIVMILSPLLESFTSYFVKVLSIMAEPAAWFFFWEGLDKIFISSKSELLDYKFFKKMSNAEIFFLDY